MLNLIATATVSRVEFDEGANVAIVYAIASRKFRNAAGDEQRSNTILKIEFEPRDPEIIHELVKGARIGVEGYFDADYQFKPDGSAMIANGPKVEPNDAGVMRAFISVIATDLYIVGPVEDKLKYTDVLITFVWGFLGRDVELQQTQSGKNVAHDSIASNNVKYDKNADGTITKTPQTIWWRLNLWGDRAVNVLNHWKKGKALILWGRPQVDAETGNPQIWKDRDGLERANYELTVSGWVFAPSRKSDNAASDADYQEPISNVANGEDEEIPF
jgi:single-stranded DNA-binding protein